MRLFSEDGQWRVTSIVRDSQGLIRIEQLGNGGRTWYRIADVTSPAQVGKYVALASLVPEQRGNQ